MLPLRCNSKHNKENGIIQSNNQTPPDHLRQASRGWHDSRSIPQRKYSSQQFNGKRRNPQTVQSEVQCGFSQRPYQPNISEYRENLIWYREYHKTRQMMPRQRGRCESTAVSFRNQRDYSQHSHPSSRYSLPWQHNRQKRTSYRRACHNTPQGRIQDACQSQTKGLQQKSLARIKLRALDFLLSSCFQSNHMVARPKLLVGVLWAATID